MDGTFGRSSTSVGIGRCSRSRSTWRLIRQRSWTSTASAWRPPNPSSMLNRFHIAAGIFLAAINVLPAFALPCDTAYKQFRQQLLTAGWTPVDCEQTERVYISDYPELCAATREDVGFAHWEDPRTDSRLRFMTWAPRGVPNQCVPPWFDVVRLGPEPAPAPVES